MNFQVADERETWVLRVEVGRAVYRFEFFFFFTKELSLYFESYLSNGKWFKESKYMS